MYHQEHIPKNLISVNSKECT